MSMALFARPVSGRLWQDSKEDPDYVTIIGIDTDAGTAAIVDDNAFLHIVQYKTLDFLSLTPHEVNGARE